MDISTIKKELNRNIIFKSLISPTVPLLDALIFSSGNYLPKSKIKEGNCKVYGGGGDTKLTHNQYNIESETIAIGRVGARCGCVFKVESNSWVTDNALYIKQKTYEYNNDFLIEYLTFLNLNRFANTAAQPVISLKRISNCLIPVLSINKQEEILNRINNDNNSKFHVMIDNSANLISEFKNQLEIISQLRQAFLREAMQGKLVSNETSDGKTGADLLTEIQAEKAQLIKEKKIKKSKPLPPISEDEIPFDIPENWTWCRLGDILISDIGGGTPSKSVKEFWNGDIKWASVKDLNVKYLVNTLNSITELGLKKSSSNLIKENNIIICTRMGLGKIVINKVPIAINQDLRALFFSDKISKEFFYNFYKTLDIVGKGMTVSGIRKEDILSFYLPLPPLEIQHRTVSRLDELMNYCNDLENSVKESQQYNEMLLQQVLREALEGKEESKPQLKVNKTCDNNDTAILASYIIQELHTPDFGRTKLQKILHLAEYHCRLETPLQYYKKTAGPYSKNLENDIENLLRRNKLYDSRKEELKNSDKSKVNYMPLSGAKQINSFFTTEFKDQKEDIDNLLKKFNDKTMEFCEMISTMYAVWNNRLIKGEIIDNEELKKDFLAWDPQKIKFLDKLDYSIEWIKKEGLEPTGFGKYIDKQ
ncbi:restriction endonuclease subunit S [Chryseobacterium cucumeris]|uniref:restriction endonuclease subunit S n=1 Tax=Chryseobacterium cucumeris TaxID=1813611 RepID=UPI0024562B99|nr:restriction endonuclease subunit S [Chryseobacterium cucumeris]MDH5032435.1 restriction endonuclease subunit S [Chryseobacterium cucumeris]